MLTEKEINYFNRTLKHIQYVQENMLLLITNYSHRLGIDAEMGRTLMYSVLNHDRSKFSNAQFIPYIELTEYYRQRKNLGNETYDYPSEEMKKYVEQAVWDHYVVENHHPEKFKGTVGKWDILNTIECACDLQAMAQEFNEGTCRKYYEDVWKKRSAQYFYDDYNWVCVTEWMNLTIKCFEDDHERKLKAVQETLNKMRTGEFRL